MIFLFYIIAGFGFYFFAVRRRVFDIPALAFCGALMYFLPAFFGVVRYHVGGGMYREQSIAIEAYVVYCVVLAAVILAGYISDLIGDLDEFRIQPEVTDRVYAFVLFAIALGATLAFVAMEHGELTSAGKPNYGRAHPMFQVAVSVAVVFAAYFRKKWWLAVLSIFLIADVYGGNREGLAMATAASVLVVLISMGRQRLVSNWQIILCVMVVIVALMAYKGVYVSVLANNWGLVFQRVVDMGFWKSAILASEPFTTQSILNRVITDGFTYDGGHYRYLQYHFVLMPELFGVQSFSVSDAFEYQLFYDREAGVASNIWAEAYAIGGIVLACIYGIMYGVIALGYNILLNKCGHLLKPFVAIAAAYMFIFMHRTGLLYQVTIQRRVVMILLLWFGVSVILGGNMWHSKKGMR